LKSEFRKRIEKKKKNKRKMEKRAWPRTDFGPTNIGFDRGDKTVGVVALPVDSRKRCYHSSCAATETPFPRTVDFAAAGPRLWQDLVRRHRSANSPAIKHRSWVWELHQVRRVTEGASSRRIARRSTRNCLSTLLISPRTTRHRPQGPLHRCR
jgi:hypothetical protein